MPDFDVNDPDCIAAFEAAHPGKLAEIRAAFDPQPQPATGPWIEGEPPKDGNVYLVQIRHCGIAAVWFDKNIRRAFRFKGPTGDVVSNRIFRYAVINQSPKMSHDK